MKCLSPEDLQRTLEQQHPEQKNWEDRKRESEPECAGGGFGDVYCIEDVILPLIPGARQAFVRVCIELGPWAAHCSYSRL